MGGEHEDVERGLRHPCCPHGPGALGNFTDRRPRLSRKVNSAQGRANARRKSTRRHPRQDSPGPNAEGPAGRQSLRARPSPWWRHQLPSRTHTWQRRGAGTLTWSCPAGPLSRVAVPALRGRGADRVPAGGLVGLVGRADAHRPRAICSANQSSQPPGSAAETPPQPSAAACQLAS